MAVYLPVRILSIRRLRCMLAGSRAGLITRHRCTRFSMKSEPHIRNGGGAVQPALLLHLTVRYARAYPFHSRQARAAARISSSSLRQLGSRKPHGNAGLHGVILDEVHDGVDGAVNGAAHIVRSIAEIDRGRVFPEYFATWTAWLDRARRCPRSLRRRSESTGMPSMPLHLG